MPGGTHQGIAHPGHLLLRRQDRRVAEPKVRDRNRETTGAPDRRLRCAACGNAVTVPAEATAIAGGHAHTCTNPAGVTFRIGCFTRAPGCDEAGEPTTEHSWFPGYRWRVAFCRRCGTHLGWAFSGPGRFFGLILARLRPGP